MGICQSTEEAEEQYVPLIVRDMESHRMLEDFQCIKLLGKGAFGKVVMVRQRSSEEIYAMKVLEKKIVELGRQEKHTKTERNVLATISHPFIVHLHRAMQTPSKLYFVMEFASGGDLFFHLRRERTFTEERVIFYAAEIMLALECLHKNGVIYRDLKLENVMLDSEGHIKLGDFGLAKDSMRENMTAYTFCGTPEYLAPEIIEELGYDKAADWWSFGVLVYEMLNGRSPFKASNRSTMLRNIVRREVVMPPHFSKEAVWLLTELLNKNPMQRLGSHRDSEEIKTQPFFKSISWDALLNKKIPPPFVPDLSSSIDYRYFDKPYLREYSIGGIKDSIPEKGKASYDGFSYIARSLIPSIS